MTGPHHTEKCGATFFVNSATGQVLRQIEDQSQSRERLEAALDSYCEPSTKCYWNSETGEVSTVFTRINRDGSGSVIKKRRKLSIPESRPRGYTFLNTKRTPDGYGVEQVFRLTPNSSHNDSSPLPTPNYSSPVVAKARTRRSRLGQRRRVPQEKQSDAQLLKERLELHQNDLGDMREELGQNPHLRGLHWYQDGRSFAFASAFVQIDSLRKAVVGLFWETKTRPHRAVCVSFSLESVTTDQLSVSLEGDAVGLPEPAPNAREELVLVANCTCSHLLSQTKGTKGGCYHAQICLGDKSFVEAVSREILRREEKKISRRTMSPYSQNASIWKNAETHPNTLR